MAQILPRDTIAERLGQGLGAGVNTGINALLNQKLQQMQSQATQSRSFKNLVQSGYDPQTAQFISGFDPKDQVKLLTNLWQRGYNPTALGQNQNQIPNNLPENIQEAIAPLGNNEPVQPQIEQILAPQGQATPESIAQLFAQQAPQFAMPNQPMNAAALGAIGELRKGLTREVPQPQQPEPIRQEIKQQAKQVIAPERPKTVADILSKPPPPSPDTQAKLNQQQEQFDKKFKHDLNKESSKFLDPYSDKAEASRNNIRDYNLIIDAAKKGDLRAGNVQVLLDKFGLGDFGKNLTTQIVEKSMQRLGQNAGAAFGQGTRLTNYLEQTYQRSLPRLWNTPQGVITISEMNKLMEEANLLREEEAVKVIKENNGEKPFNAKQLVAQRIQPQLDELAQRAINLLEPQQFNVTQVLQSLPNPAQYKGRRARDTNTGQIMLSDGTKWIPQ